MQEKRIDPRQIFRRKKPGYGKIICVWEFLVKFQEFFDNDC